MRCVSLFSGAGGLDLGLNAAGFEISAVVESDPDCCATLEANGRKNIYNDSTGRFSFAKLARLGSIDLLVGGPPCQPFSKSALWTEAGAQGLNDSRTSTISDFVRAVAELKPRAFILENVEGFFRLGGINAFSRGIDQLSHLGLEYHVHCKVINAAEYGIPQKRVRFFAVGVRHEANFTFPAPTHGAQKPYLTAWDALSRVKSNLDENLDIKGRWSGLIPSIPAGENYLWHTSRKGGVPLFGWRTRYWSFLYKLNPEALCPTIVANPSQNSGPFHWENRLLSTEELAALQTFPSGYVFCGNRSSRQRQIGNAVPPLLAEQLGRSIASSLGNRQRGPLQFGLVPTTRATPKVTVSDVAPSYLKYIGEYAAHPGPGMGPKPRKMITQRAEGPS